MVRKISAMLFVALALVALCAWAPWMTSASAESRAVDSFDHAWEGVADGCGLNCKGCGSISAQRVPFGVRVTLEFACGLIPADSPEYHRQATVFISALGTVHGLPKP